MDLDQPAKSKSILTTAHTGPYAYGQGVRCVGGYHPTPRQAKMFHVVE